MAPLGIGVVAEGEGWAVIGKNGEGQFWFGSFGSSSGAIHITFAVESRQQVLAFHAAVLAAGAKDNGAPGIRPHYRCSYAIIAVLAFRQAQAL